jgi:histidinol phosphatase-like PHP family hydrolase
VEHYVATARKLGLTKIGFSDHFGDGNIPGARGFYRAHPFEHNAQLKAELAAVNEPGLKLYFGCETEYHTPRREVGITEAEAEQFDFVVVPNSHTHMMMPKDFYEPYEKHKEFMIEAYNNILDCNVSRYILSMAHPFEAVCCPYDNKILMKLMSDDEYKRLFDRTAEKGIAIEINTSGKAGLSEQEIYDSEPFRLYRIAKECGCKFTFGSDSHNNVEHNSYAETCESYVKALGLKEADLHELVI